MYPVAALTQGGVVVWGGGHHEATDRTDPNQSKTTCSKFTIFHSSFTTEFADNICLFDTSLTQRECYDGCCAPRGV